MCEKDETRLLIFVERTNSKQRHDNLVNIPWKVRTEVTDNDIHW